MSFPMLLLACYRAVRCNFATTANLKLCTGRSPLSTLEASGMLKTVLRTLRHVCMRILSVIKHFPRLCYATTWGTNFWWCSLRTIKRWILAGKKHKNRCDLHNRNHGTKGSSATSSCQHDWLCLLHTASNIPAVSSCYERWGNLFPT